MTDVGRADAMNGACLARAHCPWVESGRASGSCAPRGPRSAPGGRMDEPALDEEADAGGPSMIKIWSELRVARVREQVADLATLVWLVFWGSIVWQLFQFLASFAPAGRTIRAGGETMVQSGRDLGDSLAGVPLIGSQLRDIARTAFAAPGRPLSDFGTQLEQFIVVVSAVLALLLSLIHISEPT